ncbi:MAG: DUF2235 domain-containing protein [Burkholderiaceae bacterium]|nr:DUF2235 domain-containing protein [Burkholderiaceae bacterium]
MDHDRHPRRRASCRDASHPSFLRRAGSLARLLAAAWFFVSSAAASGADGLASILGGAAAAPGTCTPAGGAPGAGGSSFPIGGGIGIGVGGSAIAQFIAEVERASRPPRPAPVGCDAPPPRPREPASLPPSSIDRSAGNPVDVVTGNKYERQVDIVLAHAQSSVLSPDGLADAFGLSQDDTLNLLVARHYNSRSDFALTLGRGWSHSFETRLARIVRDGRVELQIVQADGRRIVFRPQGAKASRAAADEPRRYAARTIDDGLVDEQRSDGTPISYVWRWPGGRLLNFDRDGQLESIVSADLDTIRVARDARGRIVEVRDDAQRTIGFEYDDTRLVALRLPDGQRIRYEFDAHRQLVAVRYPDGRTLRYEYGDPRAFHRLTSVIDTDGRRSEYRYGDDGRVQSSRAIGEAEGQALRFEYELPAKAGARGTTTIRVADTVTRYRWRDGRGEPMLVESDGDGCRRCPPIGLRVRVAAAGSAVALGEMHIRRDAQGRVVERRVEARNGRAAWFERFSYAAGSPWATPIRIVRPSVVVGRESRIDLRYNERMQIAAIEFDGHLPDDDGVQPLRAIVRFEYAGFDTRPERAAVRGRLAAIVRVSPDGSLQRTTFRHDAQRRLVGIEADATIAHRIERDALGRAVAERLPDGATRRRSFDAAWRLASTAARGTTVSFGYDDAGRPRTIDWSGGERWTIRLAGPAVEIESNHGWRERIVPGAKRVAARGLPVALARVESGRHVLVDALGRRTERRYDDLGRLVETRSPHEGRKRYRYDGFGRLSSIAFADGSVDSREHDAGGRLVRRLQRSADDRAETTFRYEGAQLFAVEHDGQRSIVRHDDEGRVVERLETRDGRDYHERLEYDARGRLAMQWLADGSRLRHRYDAQGRREALDLALPQAEVFRSLVRRVAAAEPQRALLEMGNGIRFERRDDAAGQPVSLAWRRSGEAPEARAGDAAQALPFRRLRWDPAGLPLAIAHEAGEDRYAYDRFGRLIARERHASAGDPVDAGRATHVEYFALDALGGRIAVRRRDGSDARGVDAASDATGLPRRLGTQALRYGAQRRVVEVQGGGVHALYRYDAFGRRVAKRVDAGASPLDNGVASRGFLYRDQRLAAETDGNGRLLRQYVYWNAQPIAVLEHDGTRTSLAWLHNDHLGAPIAATDEAARVVWRGERDAWGALARQTGSLHQPLRLPGQYHDAETGLHDNLLRSYDPGGGRYLEPDPLGLAAGLDPYAYADGNPLVGVDPLGLLLFAFDGTGNGASSTGGEDVSNVRKFFEASDDPDRWYMAGVGRDDYPSGITATSLDWAEARTARERVDWMIGTLDRFLDDAWIGRVAPVDVIGFSRGAAMARDFVNRVASMIDAGHFRDRGVCVDLRFLGLWDTVAQFGFLGLANQSWQLAIPSTVRATYHAVAVNEHRTLFPLESALGSPAWVVERGFVGSHADIGGGNAEGDLSDVTLVWMTRMAQSLGVPVRDPLAEHRIVSDPRVHGRDYISRTDRSVYRRDVNGTVVQQSSQRTAVVPGLDWKESLAFLVPFPQRQRDAGGWPSLVGRVDMEAYGAWLRDAYGVEVRR